MVVSIIMIACPDALALGTPAAIIVRVGQVRKIGVLFKNASALEPIPGTSEEELPQLAALDNQSSQHPVAAEIVQGAEDRGLMMGEISNQRGPTLISPTQLHLVRLEGLVRPRHASLTASKRREKGVHVLTMDVVAEVLMAAHAGGADWAELLMEDTVTTTLYLHQGEVEDAGGGNRYGAGLHLRFGTRVVYGYTNDALREGLLEVADTLDWHGRRVRQGSPTGVASADWTSGSGASGRLW